jgi:molecular chaperone HtpG
MNRQEVVDNIGTIARSGTKNFLQKLTGDQAKDTQLIGQFGVGFYSSFIVAQKVVLTTRRAGLGAEHGVRWESAGEGDFTLEQVEKAGRGTEVTLYLKDDEDEFLDSYRLRHIIERYSDHIAVPIQMSKEDKADEFENVNKASAIWKRAKKDITEAEYNEFYKHVSHDFQDPLTYVHSNVEGTQSYSSLLYIPQRAPFDMWDRDKRRGLKLYVRRVFIMDAAEELMPDYLRFVRGVIDSDDLPLNISREILQKNKHIDAIKNASVKKVLSTLENLAKDDATKYATFWKEFGRALKEGPAEDFANKERIAKLFRFASTHTGTEEQNVSLDDYITRMKTGQEKIYYITADTFAAAKNSPHLEVFRKNGIEVLLMTDRVDEWLMSHLTEYMGKHFQSVAKGALELGDLESSVDKEQQAEVAKQAESTVKRIKDVLGDRVKDVRVTHRLTTSASCLVVEDHDMATNLQRMLKSAGHEVPTTKPILEVNPTHPLLQRMDKEQDTEKFAQWSMIMFDQAVLAEGGQLEDPAGFVSRLNELLLNVR